MAAAAAEPLTQRYQGVQKESAGYRLMTAMGWKEGEGLGAEKQGIKEHIRVKKNLENWGVGAVTAADHAKNWSVGMADFHRVLSTLSEVTSQHAGKRKGSDDGGDGETTTDEESDASDGELRDGGKKWEKKRARKEEAAAKKKAEKKKKKKAKASSSEEEEEEKEEDEAEEVPLPAKRVKLATHVGRFHKRENAKKVKNYSQLDLAAILGEDPFAATAAAVQSVQNTAAYLVSSSGSDSDIESPSLTAPKRQLAQQAQAGGAAEEAAVTEELWWSSYFVRRGKMGSMRKTTAGRKEFSEKDQVDLYTSAHGGATKGRVGLGRSSMPKKVGGVRWSGKKVTFGGDSDDGEGEGGGEEEGSEEAPLGAVEAAELAGDDAHGIVIIMPPSKRGAAAGEKKAAAAAAEDSGSAGKEKKVKWKKVIAEVLREQQPGGMKLKGLAKAVAERLGMEKGKEAKAAVAAAVKKSSQFVEDGKMVRLVP